MRRTPGARGGAARGGAGGLRGGARRGEAGEGRPRTARGASIAPGPLTPRAAARRRTPRRRPRTPRSSWTTNRSWTRRPTLVLGPPGQSRPPAHRPRPGPRGSTTDAAGSARAPLPTHEFAPPLLFRLFLPPLPTFPLLPFCLPTSYSLPLFPSLWHTEKGPSLGVDGTKNRGSITGVHAPGSERSGGLLNPGTRGGQRARVWGKSETDGRPWSRTGPTTLSLGTGPRRTPPRGKLTHL